MKKPILTLSVIFSCIVSSVFGQQFSENGADLSVRGTIRVLLVFAETSAGDAHPNWPGGQLPLDADLYFDAEIAPGGPNNLYHNATN